MRQRSISKAVMAKRATPDQVDQECEVIRKIIEEVGQVTSDFVQKRTGFTEKVTTLRMQKLKRNGIIKFKHVGQGRNKSPLVVWELGTMPGETVKGDPKRIPFSVDFSIFPRPIQRMYGYVPARA